MSDTKLELNVPKMIKMIATLESENGDLKAEIQQLRAENARLKVLLETARLGLEAMVEQDRCGENFLATVLTIENINLAIGSRGEHE